MLIKFILQVLVTDSSVDKQFGELCPETNMKYLLFTLTMKFEMLIAVISFTTTCIAKIYEAKLFFIQKLLKKDDTFNTIY